MKNNKARSLLLIAGFFLWSLLVLVGYYYIHKPVDPPFVVPLFRAAAQLSIAAALTCLAGGLGRKFLPAGALSPGERLAIQAALGWALLALAWFAVGLLELYRTWAAWAALLALLVIFRREILEWIRDWRTLAVAWVDASVLGKSLAVGCISLALGQMLLALAPPTKWDALMYHLELPRRYLSAGRFEFIEWNPYWGHPPLGDMLFTWATALGGYETAMALGWFFTALLLAGVLGSLVDRAGVDAGWLAVTALLVGFSFRGMMSWGYVDGLAALYGYAVLISTLAWIEGRMPKAYLWVGVFIGFALWTKLTAGIVLPLVGLALLVFRLSSWQRSFPIRFWHFLVVVTIAVAVFLPWMATNALNTGNPLYPHLWPTPWTPPERLAFFEREGTGLTWQWLGLPLAATWYGIEGAGVEGAVNFYADIGPLLVLFAVPGIILSGRNVRTWVIAVWLVGGWVGMVVGGSFSVLLNQTRLYFVLIPAAAMAAGWGWRALEGIAVSGIRLRRLMAVIVLLVLGLSIWQDAITLARLNPVGFLLGVQDREDYLDRALGWYAPAMRALDDLPAGSRVFFLWEPRGLYAPASARPDAWIDRWYLDRRTIGDPETILASWKAEGYTHLLVYTAGADFERQHRSEITSVDWEALDILLSRLKDVVDFGGAYALYTLSP